MFESISPDILRYIASFTYPISSIVCKAWSRHLSFSAIQADFGIETVDCHTGIPEKIARQIIGLRTVKFKTDTVGLKYIHNGVKHIYLCNDNAHCIPQLQEFTALETLIVDLPVNCVSGIHHFRHLKFIEMTVSHDIQNLSEIGKLHALEKLYISLNKTIDFEFIRENEQLETLTIDSQAIKGIAFDISHLRYNKKLKNLSLYGCNLQNDDDFQYLRSHLIYLHLSNTHYSSKSLGYLVQLKSLHIYGSCDDRDGSYLQHLVNLENLELHDSIGFGEYLYVFKHLVKLKYLKIPDWYITDISFLQGLPLVSLNFDSRSIVNFSYINSLSHLKDLVLHLTPTGDYSSLRFLDGLEKLSICSFYEYKFDLSFLHGMTNVRDMEMIGFVMTEDISHIRNMRKLKKLHLKRCEGIRDISDIRELSHLESLFLEELDTIQDLSPIECLHLDKLEIFGCDMIHDVSPLRNVKNLELRYNSKITSLGSVGKLVQLERLIIHDMQTPDVSPLASLTNLNKIDLCSFQNVTDISCLRSLTQLQSIRIRWFPNLTDISFISSLPQLTEIYLTRLPHVMVGPNEFKVYSKTFW